MIRQSQTAVEVGRRLGTRRNDPAGFSLIELLVVVSIIAILSAIAVPNFLEAQTRAKVSRVLADMRSMATAIEAYAVDEQSYPLRTMTSAVGAEIGDLYALGEDLKALTTPVAYIASIPIDIFKKFDTVTGGASTFTYGREDVGFDYWPPRFTPERTEESGQARSPIHALRAFSLADSPSNLTVKMEGFTLLSLGPDLQFGSTPRLGNYPSSPSNSWFNDYDPTNGTTSGGNIYRFSQQMEAVRVFRQR